MSRRLFAIGAVVGLAVGLGGYFAWREFTNRLSPLAPGPSQFVRFEQDRGLRVVLGRLEEEGLIRDATATWWYARIKQEVFDVGTGTYELATGMTADEILQTLGRPMRQSVRLPEGRWAAWMGQILQEHKVASSEDYLALVAQPAEFEKAVDFPLPEGSLEGYLYPDTYDLPPLLGARETIMRQLQAFEKKVWEKLEPKPSQEQLHRAVIIGSLIELEVAEDEERPIVAGVVENRLASPRPYLELDATVLYGIQEWRPLKPGEVRKLESPYNTYLHPGLPPGPIGNPAFRSIKAALNPADHEYLFYVARPGGVHIFSETYAQHLANIRKARAEFSAQDSETTP